MLVSLDDVQREIEVRHDIADAEMLDLEAFELEWLDVFALKHEHHLKQRVMRERPFWLQLFHQTLERQVLMRVCAQRDVLDAIQQILQRKLARDTGAHGERVDKKTD